MVRHAVLLALLVALFAAPLAHAAPPTEPSLRHAAPAHRRCNARPADDARAIERGLTRAVKAKRLTKSQAAHYRGDPQAHARDAPRPPGDAQDHARAGAPPRPAPGARVQRAARARPLLHAGLECALPEEARRCPADGTDVVGPHGVVYRAGWGYGLQFHPLANVGRAERPRRRRARTKQAKALANALIARAVPRRRGAVWEYYFPYGGGSPPWTSGMAQAVGAQALARAGKMTAARAGVRASILPGRSSSALGAGPWIRLYGFSNLVVLNAQLQTILSLREYAETSGNKRAAQFANRTRRDARGRSCPSSTPATGRATRWPGIAARYHATSSSCSEGSPGAPASRSGRTTHDRFDAYTDQRAAAQEAGKRQARFYPWPRDGFRDRVRSASGSRRCRRSRFASAATAPARHADRRLAPDLVEHVQARAAHVHPGRGRGDLAGNKASASARRRSCSRATRRRRGEGERQEAAAQPGRRPTRRRPGCGCACGSHAQACTKVVRARPASARRLAAPSASPRHVAGDARRARFERQQDAGPARAGSAREIDSPGARDHRRGHAMDRGLRPLRDLLPLRRGRRAARGLGARHGLRRRARRGRVRRAERHALRRADRIDLLGLVRGRRRGHRRLRARVDRRLGDRALRREAVPGTARAVAPRHAREARPGRALVRALRRDHRARLAHAARRPLLHLHPGRDRRDAARPLHRPDDRSGASPGTRASPRSAWPSARAGRSSTTRSATRTSPRSCSWSPVGIFALWHHRRRRQRRRASESST